MAKKKLKRKKILFISSWFPNKIEPTAGNFVQRHAEAVALLNNVEVLHTIGISNQNEIYVFEENIINEIRTLVVYYKNSETPIVNFLRRMKAYKIGFSKMQKPDLVHANVMHNSMLFAVYLKNIYKIPFVITEHWTALRKINHLKTSFKIKFIAKKIGNQAEYILPVSHDLKVSLQSLGISKPMKVIPNVADSDLFCPSFIQNESFTFLHISNLLERKNPEKIISAAIHLLEKGYQFKLRIGGDGNSVAINTLKNRVEKSNFANYIEVFGALNLNEVAEKMKNADCFILFSEDENQPCVISESFASGIPVISSNVGGISEFFPSNFGVLLENTKQISLEKAMLKIMQERRKFATAEEMSFYAKTTFAKSAIANQFAEIYNTILK